VTKVKLTPLERLCGELIYEIGPWESYEYNLRERCRSCGIDSRNPHRSDCLWPEFSRLASQVADQLAAERRYKEAP
jgi:hypothetical protein